MLKIDRHFSSYLLLEEYCVAKFGRFLFANIYNIEFFDYWHEISWIDHRAGCIDPDRNQ